jgi:hypothetical protein
MGGHRQMQQICRREGGRGVPLSSDSIRLRARSTPTSRSPQMMLMIVLNAALSSGEQSSRHEVANHEEVTAQSSTISRATRSNMLQPKPQFGGSGIFATRRRLAVA